MPSSESEAQSEPPGSGAIKFGKLPAGARFVYHGRKYLKLEMNLAENDTGNRTVFGSAMKVQPEEPAGPRRLQN